jgi:RNA polymerase sigma-70 factor (ECF subfamily)
MALKEEISTWVKIYTKDLFSYTITKVHQKEIAEDLVQDAFLSAYQSYENYKGKSNVKTWLFSILKHKIADYFRSKYKSSTEVSSDLIDKFFDGNHRWKPECRPQHWTEEKELLDDPEFSKALNDCFNKLPDKWSYAVQLKFLEEHNSKIICSKLEITTSNFWQIIHRAKLHLRNCLELKWFKNN